jgi:hypothetical protein
MSPEDVPSRDDIIRLRQELADARAEAALLRRRLAAAQTIGRLGTWESDITGSTLCWDEGAQRCWGFEPGGAPAAAELLARVIEADRDTVQRYSQASRQRCGPYAIRFRIVTPAAEERLLHLQWQVEPGPDGKPARMVGVVLDETNTLKPLVGAGDLSSQLALAVELGDILVYWSPSGWRTLGLVPRTEGLSLDEVRNLIHPDDLPRVAASMRQALDSDRPVDLEARYRHADGHWRTQMLRRSVLRNEQGQPVAFLGVALDITGRRAQQRRARAMAERFEAVTRAAGVGHWVNHVGQNRLEWSAECREMHGMGAHEPVPSARQWLEQWVHPDDRARVLEAMARLPAPGMAGVDTALRIVRRDGEVRQLSSHTRVEDEGDGPVIFGVLIDVTERLRFETALRGAQERITLALQGAGIGTWEMDLESRRTVWDEQMWRLRGREPQAVSPSIDELWQWTHPEDHDASRELYRRAEAASAALDNDFRIVTPDGQVRWLASRSSEVRDADGRRRRIGVNWDVTAARTAEVARRDSELARREIQAKSQFLARMSHELRTPLNAVLGFAQLMLADEAGTDGAAASRRRRLHHVQAAGKHLLELINDVLTLSGVDSGELPLVAQPVALSELLSQVLPMLQPLQAGHDVILTQAVPEGLHVSGDATRLRQVLLNLLGNAIKYNRPGGRVHVAVQADGERVRLSISDTGRGMDPLQLSHLFEPFNRLGAERSEVEGTGIGLAIVKALVERMKGSVRAESTPGVGSVFTVDLPWAAAQAANTKADADPGPQAAAGQRNGPRHTLLYVEDNPVNALIIAELVARRRDLVLHIATDGLSGVTQARTLRPELVLLDMQLPDIDGFEVLRRLRADSATAAIPVIALSANAMPEDIDRALAAGCADYWTKPLDFRAFMAGLDSLFGKSPR